MMFFIKIIVLCLLLYLCVKYFNEIRLCSYINSLNYLKYFEKLDCTAGPFIISSDGNVIKTFDYNPSITYDKDKNIMVISRISGHSYNYNEKRCEKYIELDKYKKSEQVTRIYIENELNKGFSCIIQWSLKDPQNIKIIGDYSPLNCGIKNPGFEDPRFFTFKNQQWVYCHLRGKIKECSHNLIIFKLDTPSKIVKLYKDGMQKLEKNWMPFEYNDELYFEYSISPHIILKADIESGSCVEYYRTSYLNSCNIHFGGGAPSQIVYVDGKKYFLGIGHIRKDFFLTKLTRKNFFYLFNSFPPFNIIKISPPLNFINASIEFASGLLIENNENVIISFGINDCSGMILKYKLKDVLKIME